MERDRCPRCGCDMNASKEAVYVGRAASPCGVEYQPHKPDGRLCLRNQLAAAQEWVKELECAERLHLEAWRSLRDEVLHDPDHTNEVINWALDLLDSIAPTEAAEAESDG